MEEITLYNSEQAVQTAKTDDSVKTEINKLQAMVKRLNRIPDKSLIQLNKFANNSKYIPISHLEMLLDKIFAGLWQTKNFHFTTIANEIAGSIELWYFNPSAKQWMCRIGAGAVQIQTSKGTDFSVITNKIQNTLVKDIPHLKAECFRNACLSLGKQFGRDLNREHSPAEYVEEYKFNSLKKEAIELQKSMQENRK